MFQQTTIVGNLGNAPDMRYTPQGIPVTSFSVAVNEKYGDSETVTWFRVSCWRQLAEITGQYLTKGRQVLITGRIQARAYTGRDGQPAVSLDLTADTVKFLAGGRQENGAAPITGAPASAEAGGIDSADAIDADNIPF